jgi:hypothetical protein
MAPTGVRKRHCGASAGRRARSHTQRNAQAMRDDRTLSAVPAANRPRRRATAGCPASRAYEAHRLGGRDADINVLCHDLPRTLSNASMFSVERRSTRLRCPGRARIAAPAGIGHAAAVDAVWVFIGHLQARTPTRRRPGQGPLHSSVICAAEPRCTRWRACTRLPSGSKLHPSARCTNVLVSVYTGPGATRGASSGGVGRRHAGDGREH